MRLSGADCNKVRRCEASGTVGRRRAFRDLNPSHPARCARRPLLSGGGQEAARACPAAALAPLGRDRRAVGRCREDRRPAAAITCARRALRGTIYPVNARRETVLGERAWKSVVGAARAARPRLYRGADRGRGRRGRRMRRAPACRSRPSWRPASPRPAPRARRASSGCEDVAAADRHPHRRPVEPRRRQSARKRDAHRQRGLRRARHSGRPHLLRLALRHHDRRADVARQGARHRLCGARLDRQRGGPLGRRDLRGDAR